jgi:DNA-binding response OmpR family regulator
MKRRILFIEDHDDTQELVRLVLEAGDYSVTTESTVAAGLQIARANRFDLYLIDNWLPDGTGFELCEQIREFDSATPVLFYSGAVFDSDKLKAIKAGAQGYLAKPCPFADLLRTMALLIEQADARVTSLRVHDLVA